MRAVVLAVLVGMSWSVTGGAQTLQSALSTVDLQVASTASPPTSEAHRQGRFASGPKRHCCSRKGALIAAAAGAAAAALLVLNTCDAGDCTSTYWKAIAVFGGIGAGLGAFTARSIAYAPGVSFRSGAVRFVPVLRRGIYGGVMNVRIQRRTR